jgi:hypothetical protein
MNKQNFRKMHREKGMSTLVIVLLLLFVATMVTLYTANSAIREQQISANQFRADQALSNANAGLDYAQAFYAKYSGPDADRDGVIDTAVGQPGIGLGPDTSVDFGSLDLGQLDVDQTMPVPEVEFFDVDGVPDAVDGAFNGPHTIVSKGFSDDRTATRTVTIEVNVLGLTPGGGLPGFPLIAKGLAGSLGNFSIINRYTHATIWTGSDASAFGSAETYVADPNDPPMSREDYISIAGSPDPDSVLHASYSAAGLNSDVIEGDDNLTNMTDDEFFLSFINETKDTVKAFAEGNGQRFDARNGLWDELVAENTSGLVWVDGDVSETGDLDQLGTETYPVTLIINGNLTTGGAGNPKITLVGLLYVIGDWTSRGNFNIQGGAIVEGDVRNTGSPIIVFDDHQYDDGAGNPPGGLGAINAGTWKDW